MYDFEALFKEINKDTEKTTYTNQHIPVSYSLCDDEGNTRSKVDDDPEQLIKLFVRDLLSLRKKIVMDMTD